MTFGQRLKKCLDDVGMTQKALAKKVGSTEVTINRYVNDQRIPKATDLAYISQALDVSCDYLLGIVECKKDYTMTDDEKICAIRCVVKDYDAMQHKDTNDKDANVYLKIIKSILD